jgi:hypothetical protein
MSLKSAASLSATALVVALLGCGDTTVGRSHPQVLSAAALPALLRGLEQKMQGLQIDTERYSRTSHAQTQTAGKHESFGSSETGEVSLSGSVGETFDPANGNTPLRLAVGSTSYFYSAQLAHNDGGRPWVRRRERTVAPSFPYHENQPTQGRARTGGYAGLIGLIETAPGNTITARRINIDGQQTTEFTTTVDPAALLKGPAQRRQDPLNVNNKDILIAQLHMRSLPTRLDVFITDSGLPIRVVTSARIGSYSISERTDILATNMPVKIERPSAHESISDGKLTQLYFSDTNRHLGRRPFEG